MSIEKGNHPAFQRHLVRKHAWGTPVIREGLERMVESGRAPKEVLEDPTGVAYHDWQHSTSDGAGGSPLHTHISKKPRS